MKNKPTDDLKVDKELHIRTTAIEEWEDGIYDYHRSEPTPYKALDALFNAYTPLEEAHLIDYGSGLGRINLYFHHHYQMPGIGLELHPERYQSAYENLYDYSLAKGLNPESLGISFLQVKAEKFHLPPEANTFYFFHPFADFIFSQAIERIIESIDHHPRMVDIILYYPSFGYFQHVMQNGYFEEHLFVDCDWNDDHRDGFWVFRHQPKNKLD